ncbi:copper chaperone PCu(A)C [Microbacterium esteraromaticum]|uniref:copper chaperone PCu(A)C n=1 Tax=Microbacterium esteraromaticum TaxID=57043 RepID=UPI001CD54913|nr:copper chaperone PCu(A)C [Microbacterium esteraromaticum]MCA1305575.1 copper chaperone PCu(A)C [Microbacterium esteraromaticum]
MNTNTRLRTTRRVSIVAAALLVLTGCSPVAEASSAAGESVTMTDGWVKAAPEGMTAAFGTLTNDSDEDVVVVSATTEVAGSTELHEIVVDDAGKSTMREVENGFTIPADGSLTLEPGADHLMLMGLTGPVVAGEELSFTLTFADDSTMTFTAPVKDYSGAQEEYSDHDMDHDSDHEMDDESGHEGHGEN